MKKILLALILAAAAHADSIVDAALGIQNAGTPIGAATRLNCSVNMSCSIVAGVVQLSASLSSVTINGSQNNTVMSEAFTAINEPAGSNCTSLAEFHATQPTADFAATGLFGCAVATTGTQYQTNGVFGASTNSSTSTNGIAGYFSARATAAGSGTAESMMVRNWAINPILSDGGFANVLLQNELDFNVSGSNTFVQGLLFTGASSVNANSNSAYINFLPLDGAGGTHNVPVDMQCSPGSSSFACLFIGPATSGTGKASQKLYWFSSNASQQDTSVDLFVTSAGVLQEEASLYGGLGLSTVTFANLGSPANGTMVYCSTCTLLVSVGVCTGSGSGAFAFRENGAWSCI